MSSQSPIASVETYLYFDGACDDALAFYKEHLGAEVLMLMRFKESPDPAACSPGMGDKVMHATFRIGGTTLMASDGHCGGKPNFQGFSVSLSISTAAEGERIFAALGQGGQVLMPITKTFFAERFGMVADRFGVPWMILVRP